MKKIILMLAFCGALATMSAQTNNSGSDRTRTDQEDKFTPEKKSTVQSYPGDQNQAYPQGTEKKNEKKTAHHKEKVSKPQTGGKYKPAGGDQARLKTVKKRVNQGDKTGISTTTYTPTPIPAPVFQDRTAVNPPEKVREAYNNAHSAAPVTWKREGANYLASFKTGKDKDALETIIVYDKEGKVLVTEKELASNSCPSDISKYCHSMNGSRIWEVDSKSEPRKYFIQESGETKWYDLNGNRISGSGSGTRNVVHHRMYK